MTKSGLILSRREGEEIFLGPDVVVEVLEIRGSRVKLRVAGPSGLKITRTQEAQESDLKAPCLRAGMNPV